MAGTAVFRIVVSSDSMKNATATSHGNNRLLDAAREGTVVVSDMLARVNQSKKFDATAFGNSYKDISWLEGMPGRAMTCPTVK